MRYSFPTTTVLKTTRPERVEALALTCPEPVEGAQSKGGFASTRFVSFRQTIHAHNRLIHEELFPKKTPSKKRNELISCFPEALSQSNLNPDTG